MSWRVGRQADVQTASSATHQRVDDEKTSNAHGPVLQIGTREAPPSPSERQHQCRLPGSAEHHGRRQAAALQKPAQHEQQQADGPKCQQDRVTCDVALMKVGNRLPLLLRIAKGQQGGHGLRTRGGRRVSTLHVQVAAAIGGGGWRRRRQQPAGGGNGPSAGSSHHRPVLRYLPRIHSL